MLIFMELVPELDMAILADIVVKYQEELADLVSRSTFSSVNPRLYRVFNTPMSAAWSASRPESSVLFGLSGILVRVIDIPLRQLDQLLSR